MQFIFKDVHFPVVAQRFFPWSGLFGFSLFFLPIAVHVVGAPVVQLLQVPQVQFYVCTSLYSRSDKFQQLFVPDGP